MRRRIIVAASIGVVAALLAAVPRWTAGKTEAERRTDFETAISRAIPANLPPCPLPGPERDSFLAQSASALSISKNLWVPVCRIAPLPAHRILIMTATRTDFRDCAAGSVWRPSNVLCALEEPLGFLADADARRTWARRERMDVIWTTSRSMAWQDHLVAEHRQWMTLGLLFSAIVALLFFGVQRARFAFSMRAACHGPGEPDLPRNAELLLHWALGRNCRSLPGDLGEEYLQKLDDGCSLEGANKWYRWQVFHSIAPVTARRVESIVTSGFARDAFTRRS